MRMPETVGELFLGGAGQVIGTLYHIGMEEDDVKDCQLKWLAITSQIAIALGSEPQQSIESEAEKLTEQLAHCPCGDGGQHSIMPLQEALSNIEFGTAVMIAAVDYAINDRHERQDLLERITTLAAHISVRAGWMPPNNESEEDIARHIRNRFQEEQNMEDDGVLDADTLSGAPDS